MVNADVISALFYDLKFACFVFQTNTLNGMEMISITMTSINVQFGLEMHYEKL